MTLRTSVQLIAAVGLLAVVPAAVEASNGQQDPPGKSHAPGQQDTSTTVASAATVASTATTAGQQTPPGQQVPTDLVAPAATGTAAIGKVLTASTGSWSGNGISYTLQWQRCSTDGTGCGLIAGAGGSSYTVASADVGHVLRIAVTATNHNGSTTATSGATGVVAPPPAPAPSTTTTTTPTTTTAKTTTTTPTTTTAKTTTTTTATTATTTPTTTATTTTSTASSSSGSVEFNGLATQMQSMTSTGYSSTNNLVQSQSPQVFDGLLYTNNDITLASESTFGKVFNVSAEPGSRAPYNTSAPPNDAMAELSKRQPTFLGQWRYYALAVKIPSATWHNPDWASLMSLGYETFSWDQVALHVRPGSSGPEFDLMQNSGYLNCPSTTCKGTVSGYWKIAPVTYDTWTEFVFAVKWATDNTGAVKVYMRNAGGAWTLALDRENEPTYAYGTSAYGTVSADLHEESTTLDKFGLYYGYWSTSTTSFPKNTIQSSGLVRATDLATAKSLLP